MTRKNKLLIAAAADLACWTMLLWLAYSYSTLDCL